MEWATIHRYTGNLLKMCSKVRYLAAQMSIFFLLNCPLNLLKCPLPFQNSTAHVKAETLVFLGCEKSCPNVHFFQLNCPLNPLKCSSTFQITKAHVKAETLVLFDLILYAPVNIFQLCLDGSSWVEQVLSKDKYVLLNDTTQRRR